jgi:hypothetical protein
MIITARSICPYKKYFFYDDESMEEKLRWLNNGPWNDPSIAWPIIGTFGFFALIVFDAPTKTARMLTIYLVVSI